jgi:hypothetical protein
VLLDEPPLPVDEPLEPAAGSELPKVGSSASNVEVRPPQPAIATKHKAPSQTRAPEDTTISGI